MTGRAATGGSADTIRGSVRRLEAWKAQAGGSRADSGNCDRTFRRYSQRSDDGGMEALRDKRTSKPHRRAPTYEVLALTERYRKRYHGWIVRHFHSHNRRDGGSRSYT